jgi:hypothetical protein
MPQFNLIEPDDDRNGRPTMRSYTPPRRSTRIISTRLPGNISIQAIHNVMRLKAFKVTTNTQWTEPIIDIEEHY